MCSTQVLYSGYVFSHSAQPWSSQKISLNPMRRNAFMIGKHFTVSLSTLEVHTRVNSLMLSITFTVFPLVVLLCQTKVMLPSLSSLYFLLWATSQAPLSPSTHFLSQEHLEGPWLPCSLPLTGHIFVLFYQLPSHCDISPLHLSKIYWNIPPLLKTFWLPWAYKSKYELLRMAHNNKINNLYYCLCKELPTFQPILNLCFQPHLMTLLPRAFFLIALSRHCSFVNFSHVCRSFCLEYPSSCPLPGEHLLILRVQME